MSQRPARSGGLSTLRLTALRPTAFRPTGPALVALRALVAVASAVVADRLAFDLARAVTDARQAQVESWDDAGGRFVVDAPADGWVWIDRAWWPAWQTTVDGRGVTPLRALAGQLIPVTAGRARHRPDANAVGGDPRGRREGRHAPGRCGLDPDGPALGRTSRVHLGVTRRRAPAVRASPSARRRP